MQHMTKGNNEPYNLAKDKHSLFLHRLRQNMTGHTEACARSKVTDLISSKDLSTFSDVNSRPVHPLAAQPPEFPETTTKPLTLQG